MKTINSELQEACCRASRNSRSLEQMLLTYDDVISLESDEIEQVLERCNQIIDCMNKLADLRG